jgi:hypothetical protein
VSSEELPHVVMCCGNASGNHELKLVVIGKAKVFWVFLEERGLPQKAVLLDNAPSHPRESILISDNGLITM